MQPGEEDSGSSHSSGAAAGSSSPQTKQSGSGKRHSNIYLRGLPEGITRERLLELVSPYGTVQSVRIYHAQKTMSYGARCTFSFVKFNTVVEAQEAIAGLDGTELGGNILQARLAVRDVDAAAVSSAHKQPASEYSDNIYCKNLPSSLRDSELRAVFSAYGTVISCRILRQGNATGLGGAALIRFSALEEAAAAVEALQGSRFPGSLHPLVIRFADTEEMKERKQAERQGWMGKGERGRPQEVTAQRAKGPGERRTSSASGGASRRSQGQGQRGGGGGGAGGVAEGPLAQAGAFWQPPYNPYSSLDTRPSHEAPRAAAAPMQFLQGGASGATSGSARYPGLEPAFPWHAVPVYAMPHTQPLMMVTDPSGGGQGGAGGGPEGSGGAVATTAMSAASEGHGRGGLGPGTGSRVQYGQSSDAGGGAYRHLMGEGHGGDPSGAAASGSFLPVRYAQMVHPGFMQVQQVAAQLPTSAMPVPGAYFPSGPTAVHSTTPSWNPQLPGGGGGGSGGYGGGGGSAAGSGAGSSPPFPAHVLHTIFCSNLPDQADRLYLYECFAPFGAILSVKLLKDKKGNSRRAAFINYADAAGASRAVTAMNNLPVGNNRHLHVSLRNPP